MNALLLVLALSAPPEPVFYEPQVEEVWLLDEEDMIDRDHIA